MSEINRTYKIIYFSAILSGILSIYLLFCHPNGLNGILAFTALMASGLYILSKVIKAITLLPGNLPLKLFIAGLFLIIGGASFDIVNTILHSPGLDLEANPIVRLFLAHSYTKGQIYFIGFMAQLLMISVISALWAAFLKAYPIMLKNISPQTWLETMFLILGGPNAKKINVIIGTNIDYFYYVSSATPVVVGLSLYRWYLGLEWLDLVPISRIFVPFFLMIVSFLLYTYLTFKWRV